MRIRIVIMPTVQKTLITILVFCISICTNAQYSIVPSSMGNNSFGLNEIAQTIIINGSATNLNGCYLLIECEEVNGGKAFTLRTQSTDFIPGSNLISYSSLLNAQVDFASSAYYAMQQTGKLPSGRYQIGSSNVLANQCSQVSAKGDGRVQLLNPFDGEVLNTFYPNFFWSFSEMGDFQVSYAIKISELKLNQTYADAIQFNVPNIFESNLSASSYSYPATAPALDENNKYVWQVEVSINGAPKYLSEIWMFQYKKDPPKFPKKNPKSVPQQYGYLTKQMNSGTYVFKEQVSFRYKNECRDSILHYSLYKSGTKEMIPLSKEPVKIKFGVNYLNFPTPEQMKSREADKGLYVLEVSNSRNEKWRMKFSINNQKKNDRK